MYDPTKIAFCDSETTGLNPERHPMWEIAIILPDTDEEHVWQASLTPSEIRDADPIALRINGFEDRYDPTTALRRGASAIRARDLLTGRHIVGAVPSFDEERLRREYVGAFGWPDRFPWHYRVVCVEAMMCGALGCGPGADPDEMAETLGVVRQEEKHSALADARWVRTVFERLAGGYRG